MSPFPLKVQLKCGSTRPKLIEVTCGRTSQDNKGLFTGSSPVISRSALYRVPHTLRTPRDGGFKILGVEHRTDSRRPLGLALRRRQSKREAEEDGDRRRRRQTKMDTVEDKDRLTLGTSELAASSLAADDTPE